MKKRPMTLCHPVRPIRPFPGVGTPALPSPTNLNITFLNPFTFADNRINSGSPTSVWLEVNSFNTSAVFQSIVLTRVIFDDASTTRPSFTMIPGTQTEWSAIPEPSSLGLLALGAGGLLARHRRKQEG
jgi:hypothetical protein